jgi:RND family efflux transporter MFP subunit
MSKPALCVGVSLMTLFACGEPPLENLEPVARPVKSQIVDAPQGSGVRNFPGRIESANRADLAFRVAGTIELLATQEGAQVTRGQTLARLDQTDFEIALKDRQATWDRASKDFERGKELVAEGAISRRDFDRVEANFKTADAALEQAKQNLDYTFIRAPFAGQVAQRHVDTFEEVRTGQTIYSLIDAESLEVQIDVPENIILLLSATGAEPGENASKIKVWASFDVGADKRFPMSFKEAATRADAQTQTFKITFSLAQPEDVTVLPGMTASVTVDLSALVDEQAIYYLPLTAIVGDNTMSPRVWTIDDESMTVHERKVTLGRMVGSKIEVTDGLEPGLRIITAGAAYLDEGMKVTLMQQSEQAEPRDDTDQATS